MADLPALREFLISARSRTDASGFPELHTVLARRDTRGRRRQDTGLTQAHMDLLLGRTPGTYERLERGVAVRKGVLEDVARVLKLTEDEWRTVWHFAFSADPPRPLSAASGPATPGAWQTGLDSIGSIAWINDREGRLLAHNAAFRQSFDSEEPPPHLLRWALTLPEARERLLHWETAWAPLLMARLRTALALHEDSPSLFRLRAEILANPATAKLYRAHSAAGLTAPRNATLPFRHPRMGNGWLTICTATPDDAPGTRLTIASFLSGSTLPSPQLPSGSSSARG